MPSVYVNERVKKDLYKFINRSRVCPVAFSEKRLKNPNKAIEFLLKFALRYNFEDLERLSNIPLIEGKMSPELFDNEEKRNSLIIQHFEEKEHENQKDN